MAEVVSPTYEYGTDELICTYVEPESKYPPRIPLPINEYGVVLPPPLQECIGEGCKYRQSGYGCEPTCHHIESSDPYFLAHGTLAYKFKNTPYLTAWMARCRHDEHHSRHFINAPVPKDWVMERALEEAGILGRIDQAFVNLRGLNSVLFREDAYPKEKTWALRGISDLMLEQRENLRAVDTIRVIPKELVTGAMLIASPKKSYGLIHNGSGFVLTGNIPKSELSSALNFGNEAVVRKAAEDLGVAALHFSKTEEEIAADGQDATDVQIRDYLEDKKAYQKKREEITERISRLTLIRSEIIASALAGASEAEEAAGEAPFGLNNDLVRKIERRWAKESRRKARRRGLVPVAAI